MTRLEALRFVNELLCALYGMADMLVRLNHLPDTVPPMIAKTSGQIGILISEIEQGRLSDFP